MQAYLDEPNISPQDWLVFIRLIEGHEVSTRSSLVDRFEREMAEFLHVPVDRVLATNSGTSALIIALATAETGKYGCSDRRTMGTSALTFAATFNAMHAIGVDPYFYDVDPDTWVMDIGHCWAATMPVDLYGNQCPTKPDSTIIRDACESLGTKPRRNKQYYCLSFNGNKTMTTGAGGFLVSPTAKKSERARELANPSEGGYNYRMAGLNAALGLIQLRRLGEFIRRKKAIRAEYAHELGDIIRFQQPTPGTNPCFWMTAGTFPEDVDVPTLQLKLQKRGVPTRRVFRPLANRGECPVAWSIYDHGLCLPSSTKNSPGAIRWVCEQIKEALNG